MSIGDLSGKGLRILLLGSYDRNTKQILHHLRRDLNNRFQRYLCFTVLLENTDVFVALQSDSHDFSVFIETEEQFHGSATIFQAGPNIVETINFKSKDEFENTIGYKSKTIDFSKFRKLKEFEKLLQLANWSDAIYMIKDEELTRGGELIEATYLLLRNDINYSDKQKLECFFQKKITSSTMLKELFGIHRTPSYNYDDYDSLASLLFQQTEKQISRLNVLMNRFVEFERGWHDGI